MNKQKRATIISKNHKSLNFGQTCSVVDFDVANKNYVVRPDGEKGLRDVPYRQLFVHLDKNYPTLLKVKLDNLSEQSQAKEKSNLYLTVYRIVK
jgi:hypothetical protein